MNTQYIDSVVERIWKHYFTGTFIVDGTPILTVALLGFFGFGFMAFLTMGFDTLPLVFFALAVTSFIFFIGVHFLLWIAGSIYRHGFFGSVKLAGGFLFVVGVVVTVGFFLLYGWVIPLLALLTVYGAVVPEPFASILFPVFIIFAVVFAGTWFSKGIPYFESI